MSQYSPSPDGDHVQMVLIVVGAHLRAEAADRPLANRLRSTVREWITDHEDQLDVQIEPVVCCDIWYINQDDLHGYPTICIGGPGVNALSAYYGQRLENAHVDNDRMVIQLDDDFVDLRACVWGMDHDLTVECVDLFEHMYLDGFLRAVATQVEPQD